MLCMLRPQKRYSVYDLQQLKGKRCLTHIHVKSPEEAAAADQAGVDLMSCSFDSPESQARLPRLVLNGNATWDGVARRSDSGRIQSARNGCQFGLLFCQSVYHRSDGPRRHSCRRAFRLGPQTRNVDGLPSDRQNG